MILFQKNFSSNNEKVKSCSQVSSTEKAKALSSSHFSVMTFSTILMARKFNIKNTLPSIIIPTTMPSPTPIVLASLKDKSTHSNTYHHNIWRHLQTSHFLSQRILHPQYCWEIEYCKKFKARHEVHVKKGGRLIWEEVVMNLCSFEGGVV